MGGFYLCPIQLKDTLSKAKIAFERKGLSNGKMYPLGDFILLSYGKVLYNEQQLFQCEEGKSFVFGTLSYKSLCQEESLAVFTEDYFNNCTENNAISGTFCIIMFTKGRIIILNDYENLYSVYHNQQIDCFSSSFLAMCEVTDILSVNKDSLRGNLLTGLSIGFSTYFNEIERIRFNKIINKNSTTSIIEIGELRKNYINKKFEKRDDALDHLSSILESIIKRYNSYVKRYGCDIGLSGGHDSRLLLAVSASIYGDDKLSLHSNYKEIADSDLVVARTLSNFYNKHLNEVQVTNTQKMDSEHLLSVLNNAMNFYDGQFRVNHGWTREYRTIDYRKKILGKTLFGFSGHNGELLRNYYYLDKGRFSFKNWVKNEVIGQSALKKLNNSIERNDFNKHVISTLKVSMNITDNKFNINMANKYYNEIWLPSGPGIRASVENILSYYASPFTDYKLTSAAYNIIPWLGKSNEFEELLTKKINPSIAEMPYGRKRKNINNSLTTTIIFRLGVDLRNFNRIYIRRLTPKLKTYAKIMMKNYSFIGETIEIALKYADLKLHNYLNNLADESEFDRLIAAGFVLKNYQKKIKP
jgi:hypothetical protein